MSKRLDAPIEHNVSYCGCRCGRDIHYLTIPDKDIDISVSRECGTTFLWIKHHGMVHHFQMNEDDELGEVDFVYAMNMNIKGKNNSGVWSI